MFLNGNNNNRFRQQLNALLDTLDPLENNSSTHNNSESYKNDNKNLIDLAFE